MSKIENMVPYCARMPRGLLDQAKAAAKADGMSFSELVRFLLREYVRGWIGRAAADEHFRAHSVPGVPAGLCSTDAPLSDEEMRAVADDVMRRLGLL